MVSLRLPAVAEGRVSQARSVFVGRHVETRNEDLDTVLSGKMTDIPEAQDDGTLAAQVQSPCLCIGGAVERRHDCVRFAALVVKNITLFSRTLSALFAAPSFIYICVGERGQSTCTVLGLLSFRLDPTSNAPPVTIQANMQDVVAAAIFLGLIVSSCGVSLRVTLLQGTANHPAVFRYARELHL